MNINPITKNTTIIKSFQNFGEDIIIDMSDIKIKTIQEPKSYSKIYANIVLEIPVNYKTDDFQILLQKQIQRQIENFDNSYDLSVQRLRKFTVKSNKWIASDCLIKNIEYSSFDFSNTNEYVLMVIRYDDFEEINEPHN